MGAKVRCTQLGRMKLPRSIVVHALRTTKISLAELQESGKHLNEKKKPGSLRIPVLSYKELSG
jgi:hypothetical protein